MVQQKEVEKKYPTLGCCGLDCGLCPRYYTKGPSRCPGCYGKDFFKVNPGCGFTTCCVKKNDLEVCTECSDFPCNRFDDWFSDKTYDSWLTHQKVEENLKIIKEKGLQVFLKQQQRRINLLEKMLKDFNEGRSKSFYCLSATLLSIEGIEKSIQKANEKSKGLDLKSKAKVLKEELNQISEKEKVELKLIKPPTWK